MHQHLQSTYSLSLANLTGNQGCQTFLANKAYGTFFTINGRFHLEKNSLKPIKCDLYLQNYQGNVTISIESIIQIVFKKLYYNRNGIKPIDNDELHSAIKNALKNIQQKNNYTRNQDLLNHLAKTSSKSDKLIIPTDKGLLFVPHNEILHIEGYEGYTKIHTDTSEIISSYNIGKYEKMLCDDFFKCHKSHIINLQKVRAFENEGYILLENKKRVPLSKVKRKEFVNLFST